VSETPEDVTLTAIVVETTPGIGLFGGACTSDLQSTFTTVTLEQPLAGRTLLGCAPQGRGGDPRDCNEQPSW
jgi:hypothetical protein